MSLDGIVPDDLTTSLPDDSLHASELALRKAQLASDVSTLDTLIDEQLVFTGPDGALYGKSDDLDAHRRGLIRIDRLDPSEEHIQRFDRIAVVSVRMEMSGAFQGTPGGQGLLPARDGPNRCSLDISTIASFRKVRAPGSSSGSG